MGRIRRISMMVGFSILSHAFEARASGYVFEVDYSTARPSQISEAVDVFASAGDQVVQFNGPQLKATAPVDADDPGKGEIKAAVSLVAEISVPSKTTSFSLELSLHYPLDYMSFNSLEIENGARIDARDFKSLEAICDGSACLKGSSLMFDLPSVELLQSLGEGFAFKVLGAENELIEYVLPQSYIQSVLSAIEEYARHEKLGRVLPGSRATLAQKAVTRKWVPLKQATGVKVEIDLNSIRSHGDNVVVSFRHLYMAPIELEDYYRPAKYLRQMDTRIYDCSDATVTPRRLVRFADKRASHVLEALTYPHTAEAYPIEQDSLDYLIFNYACEKWGLQRR